ncbi:MAG: hypothetical protein AAF092_17695 [Pseudomonadota bacterium]
MKLDVLLDPVANGVIVVLALGVMPLLALTTGQVPQAFWHLAILGSVIGIFWLYTPQPVFGPALVILLYANSMHFFDRIDALALAQTDLMLMWRAAMGTLAAGLMVSAWRGGHIH